MPSVKSYFNRELFCGTLRRTWPLWAAYTFVWLLLLPVKLFTDLNDRHVVYSRLSVAYELLNSSASAGVAMAAVFGIFFAMAMFAYLTNPRATNGIHAMPIRREGLFLTHYAAGLFCQVTTLLVSFALSALTTAAFGVFDFYSVGTGLLANLLLVLFFYSFGVLCMICTGQVLAGAVFYGILNFLAVGMNALLTTFAGNFLYGYDNRFFTFSAAPLSPVVNIFHRLHAHNLWQDGGTVRDSGPVGVVLDGLDVVAVYAAVGLVLATLALLLYRTRKSEMTGNTVAITWLRPVFKYGVSLCSAFSLGQLLSYFVFQLTESAYTVGALVGTILCMILSGLIGYYAAEMLLKKSFRVFRASWKGALATVIVFVLVGISFPLDLTGYQSYVPEQDEIEHARIDLYSDGNINDHFELTEPESIALLRDAHYACILDKPRQTSVNRQEPQEYYCHFGIDYILTDGTRVSRCYDLALTPEMLADLSSPESTLTKLAECAEITQQRILGGKLPGNPESMRITGGYIDCSYYPGGEFDRNEDAELDAIQANNVFIALMQDCVEGNIANATLFEENERGTAPTTKPAFPDEYYLNLELWYYDASDTPHTVAVEPHKYDATVEYNASFYTRVTPEMIATLNTLRALNLIDIPLYK